MLNVNLLPWRRQFREEICQQFFVLLASASVLAVLCLLVTYIFLITREEGMRKDNFFLAQEVSALSPGTVVAKNFIARQAVIRQTILLANQLETGRDFPIRILKVLEALPKSIELRQVIYNNNQLVLSVVASTTGHEGMSHIIDQMNKTTLFRDVRITDFQPLTNAEAFSEAFKITATFKPLGQSFL